MGKKKKKERVNKKGTGRRRKNKTQKDIEAIKKGKKWDRYAKLRDPLHLPQNRLSNPRLVCRQEGIKKGKGKCGSQNVTRKTRGGKKEEPCGNTQGRQLFSENMINQRECGKKREKSVGKEEGRRGGASRKQNY